MSPRQPPILWLIVLKVAERSRRMDALLLLPAFHWQATDVTNTDTYMSWSESRLKGEGILCLLNVYLFFIMIKYSFFPFFLLYPITASLCLTTIQMCSHSFPSPILTPFVGILFSLFFYYSWWKRKGNAWCLSMCKRDLCMRERTIGTCRLVWIID